MKLALITSSRADYGLLRPFILKADKDPFFDLKVIATGSHLSSQFGNTYKEIEADNIYIYKKIKIIQPKDTPTAITVSCSVAIKEFGELYSKLKPDAILVLGDRYEIFCSVFAALFFKIPVIHYSGGEKTIGAFDDAIRHSITKMSHLHFVSCTEYRNRVIQLGEDPKSVFNVGSLGVDNIKNIPLLKKEELEAWLGVKLLQPVLLVSYYPETLSDMPVKKQFAEVLKALDQFPQCTIIFTKANADTDGRLVSAMIDDYVKKHKNCRAYESLGVIRYLSAIKYSTVVVGNSSSGYTEAPSFHKPTVNIGNRQKGRVKAESIVDVEISSSGIVKGIKTALSEEFQKSIRRYKNPFGNGKASEQIIRLLKKVKPGHLIQKNFYDLPS